MTSLLCFFGIHDYKSYFDRKRMWRIYKLCSRCNKSYDGYVPSDAKKRASRSDND